MDAGGASNTGTVVGTPPSGSNVAAPASLTIHAVAAPAITVVKKASVTSFSGVGTPITYTYVVTNTGNVTLSAVHVTDPQPGLSLVACPPGSLAPGAHVTCVATYATLLSDVLAGKAVNTGTASGTPPTGSAVTASSTVTVPFTPPSCYVGPWPSKVSGYPVLPDHAAPPAGVFIGQYHNEWLLYTHLVKGGTVYTGTITSTGSLLNTQLLRAEHDDKFAQPNIHTITFKFITASDLDGIAFNSTCGSTVTITLTTNNKPTAPSTVYLGNPTTSPTSLPLVFTRPY